MGEKIGTAMEPCIFCGSFDLEFGQIVLPRWGCFVRCNNCRAQGAEKESREEAIEEWNWPSRLHLIG